MIEREYKVLLHKKEYDRLLKLFKFSEAFTQVNFYYKEKENEHLDTTIRIRALKDKLFLQVKEPISKEREIHVKKEYQREVREVPYAIESAVLNSLCKKNKYHDCFYLGVLITERKVAIIENCEIAIDINYYCDVVDYELEIEFKKEIKPELISILNQQCICNKENMDGKYTRFLRKYFEMERENGEKIGC